MAEYFMNVNESEIIVIEDEDKKNSDDEVSDGVVVSRTCGYDFINEWFTFPYLYRKQQRYTPVRMLDLLLLGQRWLKRVSPKIYADCTNILVYNMRDFEMDTFNAMNGYSGGILISTPFTYDDLLVKVNDARQFAAFLSFCIGRLSSKEPVATDKCGFVQFPPSQPIAFVLRRNQIVVPSFYFQGDGPGMKFLHEVQFKLQGWDLAYLKFCLKLKQLRADLYAGEQLDVVRLADIKHFLTGNSEMNFVWPWHTMDQELLNTDADKPEQAAAPEVSWYQLVTTETDE